jgi:hypothetical protein
MQSGVRALAGKAGTLIEELGERNRCCGFGGHMQVANPDLYEEITRNRVEASLDPYIVYCANCREVFASRGKECVHILEMAFDLQSGVRVPGLQEKRDNGIKVKKELMMKNKNMDFKPRSREWDGLTLVIDDALRKDMERKLISAADVKEAVWRAESSGERFIDESDCMRLCSMEKAVLTYWVQYRETAPDTYEVFRAYYHRMRFSRED